MPNTDSITPICVLRRRREFLELRNAPQFEKNRYMYIQCDFKGPEDVVSYGITASKKLGSAVTRNFVKRRLRTLIHMHLRLFGTCGHRFVFIARPALVQDMFQSIEKAFCASLVNLCNPSK